MKVPSASKSAKSVKEKLSQVKDHHKKIKLDDAQANLSASRATHKKRLSDVFGEESDSAEPEDAEEDGNNSFVIGGEGDSTVDAKAAEAAAAEAAEDAEIREERENFFICHVHQDPQPKYTTYPELMDAVKKHVYMYGAQVYAEDTYNASWMQCDMDVGFFRRFFGKSKMKGCLKTMCTIITPDVYDENTPVVVGEIEPAHILLCFDFDKVEWKGHPEGAVYLGHVTVVFYPPQHTCKIHMSLGLFPKVSSDDQVAKVDHEPEPEPKQEPEPKHEPEQED